MSDDAPRDELTPEERRVLDEVDVGVLVEYLAEQLAGAIGTGEATLELVFEHGRFRRGYVKIGPIKREGLTTQRTLTAAIHARSELRRAQHEEAS